LGHRQISGESAKLGSSAVFSLGAAGTGGMAGACGCQETWRPSPEITDLRAGLQFWHPTGHEDANWIPDAGLVVLPWEALRTAPDPRQAIIPFADAVSSAAVETAGGPADLVGPRFDGWHASRTPPSRR